jgi:curved DNA-binding protein CbpA
LSDYYAILGVDPGASSDSVKAAYRRLARRHHPDLQTAAAPETQKARAEALMAQLNEAYAVLSDSKKRREYDDLRRLESVLVSKKVSTQTLERPIDQTQTSMGKHHARIRPRHEVDSTVIVQFSGHVRENFMNKRSGFSWSAAAFEGFDWGLEALNWSSCYCVALRSFATVDPATARKFVKYSGMVIEGCKRPIRKNYFLFLLPFLQVYEWDSVSNEIQAFLSAHNGALLSVSPTAVILLDMHHGRTLRLGCRFSDKRIEELIQSIRTSG